MSKGQEQVAETAAICRELGLQIRAMSGDDEARGLSDRLEAQAVRLEGMKERLFVKMATSVRFTQACLGAAREIQSHLREQAGAPGLLSKVEALEATAGELEAKVMSPGGIIIT